MVDRIWINEHEYKWIPIPGCVGVMEDANNPGDMWPVEEARLEEAQAEADKINAEEGTFFIFVPFEPLTEAEKMAVKFSGYEAERIAAEERMLEEESVAFVLEDEYENIETRLTVRRSMSRDYYALSR